MVLSDSYTSARIQLYCGFTWSHEWIPTCEYRPAGLVYTLHVAASRSTSRGFQLETCAVTAVKTAVMAGERVPTFTTVAAVKGTAI